MAKQISISNEVAEKMDKLRRKYGSEKNPVSYSTVIKKILKKNRSLRKKLKKTNKNKSKDKIKFCKCGCGQKIEKKPFHKYRGIPDYIRGHNKKDKHLSSKTRRKIGKSNKGKRLGYKHSEKTRRKMSEARKGEDNPFYGKHHTEEAKEKISDANWKGGYVASRERHARKYRGLGFFPFNEPFKDAHAHHFNEELVIHIPKKLHERHRHDLQVPESMEGINEFAAEYLFWQIDQSLKKEKKKKARKSVDRN